MTLRYNCNLSPAYGADAMYQFKQWLKGYGYTVVASGDGTTNYSMSADLVISPSLLSAVRGTTPQVGAWFVLQAPDGQRQWAVQVVNDATGISGSSRAWRIKFSRAAKFTGGTPSAYQVPSATDEQIIWGGGTDASPSTGTILFAAMGTYKLAMVCDDAPPYGFWTITYANSTGVPASFWMHDPLLAGTYPTLDVEPYVHYVAGGTNQVLQWAAPSNGSLCGNSTSALGPHGWYKAGMTGATWQPISALALYAWNNVGVAQAAPGDLGTNSHAGVDDAIPLFWGRDISQTVPAGWKGVSTFFRWRTAGRTNATTMSVAPGTQNYIVFADVVLNWDGSTPAL